MSPGEVSDSYDPEFSTRSNACEVANAIETSIRAIEGQTHLRERRPILDVVRGKPGKYKAVTLSMQDWRVIRFALHRALESI